ncbi:ABC transporter substrate-binding protein [Marinobacterium aestuariivivens]|uniref:ABC transporter substrate-binding protein n=1 Tax=Marinobacterium aestuariivivens TaxID=1698799 RepID=UPI0036D300F9
MGARACEQLLQRSDEAFSLICAFIPRATFESLAALYGSTEMVRQQRLTAIYLDQPLERHLRLAHTLVPDAKSIGAMFGPFSSAERELFNKAAEAEGLSPVSITLAETDNPIEKLQPVVRQSDVFLALPDSALFNRATAKWLLYVTLRQQIPVIGFSRTYVEAGALAAVYSTPEQIGRQTGELLLQLEGGLPLPGPAFPRYFTVSSNPVVARTLDLKVPDDAALAELIE